MLTRDYKFLKDKYWEMLLPTIMLTVSSKLTVIIDGILIGYFLASVELSAINIANPFIYFNSAIYYLFGVSGSLLALRAKAIQDHESSNFYFTIAIIGVIAVSSLYALFTFFFAESIAIHVLNTPHEILESALTYIHLTALSFPFLCYMTCLSFFTPADGFPRLTSRAVIISNTANLILSAILMSVFNMGIAGSAIGSSMGNVIGAAWISAYFFKDHHHFDILLLSKIKINEIGQLIYDFMTNAPEVIGKLSYTIKIAVYSSLCATYLGPIGLTAYFVYDNSETLVYMFLSGIAKVVNPIIAILYKEKDYEAIKYIFRSSLKQILIFSSLFAVLFAAYPELFARIFSITNPKYIELITIALRITAVGLIGRSISQLLASYAQSIEKNKVSSILNLSREFIIAIVAGVVFTHFFGGIGIWYAIVISDTLPILIYSISSIRFQKKNKEKINNYLFLQKTNTLTWTYERDINDIEYYMDEASQKSVDRLTELLGQKSVTTSKITEEILKNVLKHEPDVNKIDVTMRYYEHILTITFTYGGKPYNPLNNEHEIELKEIDGNLEYSPVLGFNRIYMNVHTK